MKNYILLCTLLCGLSAMCDECVNSGISRSDTYGTWTYDRWRTNDGVYYIKITGLTPNTTYTDVVVPDSLNAPYYYSSAKYPVRVVGGLSLSSMTSVIIPEGVTEISERAFDGAYGMTGIVLPSTLKVIGSYAFRSCSSLKRIDIPDGVTAIPTSCFRYCSKLTTVNLPSTLTSLGSYAFEQCSSIRKIEIPEGVGSIPDYCFCSCSGLSSVSLPSSLKEINYHAFQYCANLRKINIPEGVTYIGSYCFDSCALLSEVMFPSTLKTLTGWLIDWRSAS